MLTQIIMKCVIKKCINIIIASSYLVLDLVEKQRRGDTPAPYMLCVILKTSIMSPRQCLHFRVVRFKRINLSPCGLFFSLLICLVVGLVSLSLISCFEGTPYRIRKFNMRTDHQFIK